jgi:hypothetical protein
MSYWRIDDQPLFIPRLGGYNQLRLSSSTRRFAFYYETCNVIETHEQAGEFKEW